MRKLLGKHLADTIFFKRREGHSENPKIILYVFKLKPVRGLMIESSPDISKS